MSADPTAPGASTDPTGSAPPARPARPTRGATVVRTEQLTPHVVRVVLTGPDLEDLPCGEFTDRYVKLVLDDGTGAGPGDGRPVRRAYTVRAYDAVAAELVLDVVLHGDGVAGPWAAAAQPGDEVRLLGPGGGYAPAEDVTTHLFVGDESALPAIAVSLERLPLGHRAVVVAEVADAAEELPLPSAADVDLRWVHRSTSPQAPGEELAALVAAATTPLPEGGLDAFVHGEAGFVRDVRRHLRAQGLPLDRLSASGYWRRGRTDEAWRAEKQDWKRVVEDDDAALAAGTA